MATDVKVPALGNRSPRDARPVAEEARRRGRRRRADRQPGDRQGRGRGQSPVAGTMSEHLVKEGDTVEVGAVIARIGERGAAGAARGPAGLTGEGRRRPPPTRSGPAETPLPREETRRRRRRARRSDAVARGAPRGARAPCRSVEDPGHRQGRPADQGRRARRRQGEGRRRGARAGAPARREGTGCPRRRTSARCSPGLAGSEPRGRARQDDPPAPDHRPPASRRRRTPRRCSPPSTTSTCRR